MTKLNKIISICLSVMMLAAFMVVPVSAAGESPVSDTVVEIPINTSIYNPSEGTGSGTGNLGLRNSSTTTYHSNAYLSFDTTSEYVVVPITVNESGAYSLDVTMLSTKGISVTFRTALGETSLEDAANDTSYDYTVTKSLTKDAKITENITNSIPLQAEKTHYLKLNFSNIGSNHYVRVYSLTLKYKGIVSALTTSSGYMFPEFDPAIKNYKVYLSYPETGVTLSAETPQSDAVVTVGEIQGTGKASATISPTYGINETVNVYITCNDSADKYSVDFITTEISNASYKCSATFKANSATAVADASKLFDLTLSKTNGGKPYATSSSGYIQVDLEKPQHLHKLQLHRGNNGDAKKIIEVLASNDSDFSEGSYVTLGKTDTHETYVASSNYKQECALESSGAYRYVRIVPKGTIYPFMIYLYGAESAEQTTTGLATTVTVPSRFYTVGEQIIAATYNSEGRLVSADVKSAEPAYTTELNVTKNSAEDTVKVMIWDDFTNRNPRVASITPVTVTAQ